MNSIKLLISILIISGLNTVDINSVKSDFNNVKTTYIKTVLENNYPNNLANFQEPIELKWETLIDINYEVRFFPSMGMDIEAPVFGKTQMALDGREVIIKGFVIPLDQGTEHYSLSANPYASCFFCGNASPASVMSIYLKKGTRFTIDDYKTFKGTLYLNYDNPNEFIYFLKDAEEIN